MMTSPPMVSSHHDSWTRSQMKSTLLKIRRHRLSVSRQSGRHKLKKLIIPMLLILKLFKLKLLLFLPLILGLASFKKFLGFMALIIPGVIGYFKFCKPNSSPFSSGHYTGPQYSPAGIGVGPYREGSYDHYEYPTGHKYGGGGYGSGGVAFRDHESHAQSLAYNGWEYRNKKGGEDIKAEQA